MIAATIPDAPSAPLLAQSGRTFIDVSWTITYNGGAIIDDYEIDWKLATDTNYGSILSTAG